MKHLSIAVVLIAGLALPASAQRAEMGGGARRVGPPVGTFRGTETPTPRFNGVGVATPSRFWAGAGNGARPFYGYNGHSEHREHRGGSYYPDYYQGYYPGFYGGAGSGWVDLNYPGYLEADGSPFASGFSDSGAAANANGAVGTMDPYGPAGPTPDYAEYPPACSSASGYIAAAPAAAPVEFSAPGQSVRPQYQPQTETGGAIASEAANEEPVTLIFKDGRPSEHIHNYAITRTTLYVQDQRHREIPLAVLDLPATATANREAGVSFDVPTGAH